ncbi:MAG: hypothetical protein RJQ14_00805 [Marinoscillum sp.]
MKNLKKQPLFVAAFALIFVLVSCGGDDGNSPTETEKDIVLSALKGTWAINSSSSSFGNTGLDGSGSSVTFTETGFSFTGPVTDYVSGGSYTVIEDGSFTDLEVVIVSEAITLNGDPVLTMNNDKTQITITFSTVEAEGRVSGLGDYLVVLDIQ